MQTCANDSICVAGPRGGLATRSPLCDGCADAASRDITSLIHDYVDLAQEMPRSNAAATEARVSGTAESPVPLRLSIDELQRDIVWSLTTWEPAVREADRLNAETTAGVRDGWRVVTAVNVIAPRVHVLANIGPVVCMADGLDAGPVERTGLEAVDQLRALHRRARALLGLNRLVIHLPGDCSQCGAFSLSRESGSELVICGACGARWSADEYQRYVGLVVATMPETGLKRP